MSVKTIQLADRQALVTEPVGFDPTISYPCMMFFPGDGELTGPLSSLTKYGPHSVFNATTDLNYPMIIISVQNYQSAGVYIAAAKSLYKISTIIATGLSIGNQAWMEYAFTGAANFAQIGAFFMLSGDPEYPPAVRDPTLFQKYKSFYYGACGSLDSFWKMANVGMDNLYEGIKAIAPTLCAFDVFTGSGHDSTVWTPVYSFAWKSPAMGMNIYAKTVSLYPVAQPVVVPPVTPPVTPPAKIVKSIEVTFTDGSVQDVGTVTVVYTVGQPAVTS
jgi:hypothetical protein